MDGWMDELKASIKMAVLLQKGKRKLNDLLNVTFTANKVVDENTTKPNGQITVLTIKKRNSRSCQNPYYSCRDRNILENVFSPLKLRKSLILFPT